MKKNHIYILLLFLFTTYSFSQKNDNVKCGFFGNKTVKERNETFPFNESKKIILISYPNSESIVILDEKENEVEFNKDSLGYASIKFKIEKEFSFRSENSTKTVVYDATKIIELNQDEIDEFSNWLINYKYKAIRKHKPVSLRIANCYTPRNAIIFLNEKNKVISVLEICFECEQYYLLPDPKDFGRTLGIECDEKLHYFKNLFKQKGFQFKED